jgi:hypothetical protein
MEPRRLAATALKAVTHEAYFPQIATRSVDTQFKTPPRACRFSGVRIEGRPAFDGCPHLSL